MNSKKYFLLLMTLLLLASCSQKNKEVPTEVTKEAENKINQNLPVPQEQVWTKWQNTNETLPPIPVSTKTEEWISTKFVEPKKTRIDSSDTKKTEQTKEPSSFKVNKISKTYKSPGGIDEVTFSITLDGNKIKSVETKSIKGGEISQKLQKSFWEAINTQIAGKTLEEAKNLKAVGGASLTTKAFIEVISTL